MIQRIKYVDAFPSKVEGGYSPMNMAKNTRCRVSSSINLADHRQMRVDRAIGGRGVSARQFRVVKRARDGCHD
jgi:hypothetical protein